MISINLCYKLVDKTFILSSELSHMYYDYAFLFSIVLLDVQPIKVLNLSIIIVLH